MTNLQDNNQISPTVVITNYAFSEGILKKNKHTIAKESWNNAKETSAGHLAGMLKSIRHLPNDDTRGMIIAIVPTSWIINDTTKKFREQLLREAFIEEIEFLDQSYFEIDKPTCIVTLKRKKFGSGETHIINFWQGQIVESTVKDPESEDLGFFYSDEHVKLVKAMERADYPNFDVTAGHGKEKKHLTHYSEVKTDTHIHPCISRLGVKEGEVYEEKCFTSQYKPKYSKPKVLVPADTGDPNKNSLCSIRHKMIDEDSQFTKTINGILCKDQTSAQLVSNLLDTGFYQMYLAAKRADRNLTAPTLRKLKMPDLNPNFTRNELKNAFNLEEDTLNWIEKTYGRY